MYFLCACICFRSYVLLLKHKLHTCSKVLLARLTEISEELAMLYVHQVTFPFCMETQLDFIFQPLKLGGTIGAKPRGSSQDVKWGSNGCHFRNVSNKTLSIVLCVVSPWALVCWSNYKALGDGRASRWKQSEFLKKNVNKSSG